MLSCSGLMFKCWLLDRSMENFRQFRIGAWRWQEKSSAMGPNGLAVLPKRIAVKAGSTSIWRFWGQGKKGDGRFSADAGMGSTLIGKS